VRPASFQLNLVIFLTISFNNQCLHRIYNIISDVNDGFGEVRRAYKYGSTKPAQVAWFEISKDFAIATTTIIGCRLIFSLMEVHYQTSGLSVWGPDLGGNAFGEQLDLGNSVLRFSV
jgi:hypothetical protein